LPATTIIILSTAAIYSIYIGIQGPQMPVNISGWAVIAASGLFSTALGLIIFFTGLKRIDTANAAIISTFEVVVAVALAMIILGETLSLSKILGACLVISAVIVLARSEYEIAHAKVSHSLKTAP
jgi:drug/metabolite transporter (DMT)-like permease